MKKIFLIPYELGHQLNKIFLFMILSVYCSPANAQQPVAAFTSNIISGCAPLTLTFTDQSSGNPTNWNWDFGNGQITSNQNNTITYIQPGIYTVKLVVRNANGINSVTKTDLIEVKSPPAVDFIVNKTSNCSNGAFHFTDESAVTNGKITSWLWDFGDGTSADTKTADHIYSSEGVYNVTLTVGSDNGCNNSLTKYNFIQVVPGVKADFTNTVPVSCTAPFQVNYTNLTSGQGSLTFNWNLGNGSSTNASPIRIYNSAGDYTVTLIAKSSFGCSDSITKTVSIKNTKTDFNLPPTCISKTAAFQNSSDNIPISSSWTFGDGGTSTDINPTYNYSTPGTFRVKLVNVYAGCTDSILKNIIIQNNPVPDFTASQTISCAVPLNVQFNDNTPTATSWSWDFGDGSLVSNSQNPVHTYTATGNYSVSLTVITTGGCTALVTKTDFITISAPAVTVSNAPGGGCTPFSYSPLADVSSPDGVKSYSWDFGEGALQSGGAPTHVYKVPGSYNLRLTITSNGGCSQTFISTVNVGTAAANVDFSAVYPVVCPLFEGQFNATSSTSGVTWLWSFGDGGTEVHQNPVHAFKDAGLFDVSVTAINNGCGTTVTKNNFIEVLAPVAKFSMNVDCSSGNKVSFHNHSITNAQAGNVIYSWDFGDPSIPVSNAYEPVVSYQKPGVYSVSLSVSASNNTCSNTITKQVVISAPGAGFSVDKNQVCKDDVFILSSTFDSTQVASFQWTVANNAPVIAGATIPYSLSTNGVYGVKLSIVDINGCLHETTQSSLITVTGPTADFTTPSVNCGNNAIIFSDVSASNKNITAWKWDFGDGSIESLSSGPFTHKYDHAGVYTVSLMVTDAAGCVNNLIRNAAVTVSIPVAYFNKDTLTWCPSSPVSFLDSSKGNGLTYLWNFGDGGISLDKNPVHIFNTSGKDFSVKLKVTDSAGCSDSLFRDQYIRIRSPQAAFDIINAAGICSPLITQFTFKGTDYQSVLWNFGDGTPPSSQFSVKHAYSSYGSFTPELTVTGNGGCTVNGSALVTVTNPAITSFTYAAPETCNRLWVDFNVKPPTGTHFTLFFGDGKADSSQSYGIKHLYGSPAFYTPYLTIKDSGGCIANVAGQTVVRVIGADPLFGADPLEHCDSANVRFTNYTIGNDPVINYTWDLDDNATSGAINTSHDYHSPGIYIPQLTVTTQSGCTSSLSDTIKIYRTPVAVIISPDTVCQGSPVQFKTSGIGSDTAVSYAWTFSDGDESVKTEPSRVFRMPGSVIVNLSTNIPSGCKSNTSKPLNVVPLPTIGAMPDQTIMAGQSILLPATYSSQVEQYKWTPYAGLDCNNCATPVASPKNNTTYSVLARDRFGCEAQADVTVMVTCNNNNFFIPNTFSPNNDGVNDCFYPRSTGIVRVASLRIFNRWGEVVFEKKDFVPNDARSGWDGTYKGKPAVSDVYIYSIDVICENSQIIPFHGNILLIR